MALNCTKISVVYFESLLFCAELQNSSLFAYCLCCTVRCNFAAHPLCRLNPKSMTTKLPTSVLCLFQQLRFCVMFVQLKAQADPSEPATNTICKVEKPVECLLQSVQALKMTTFCFSGYMSCC